MLKGYAIIKALLIHKAYKSLAEGLEGCVRFTVYINEDVRFRYLQLKFFREQILIS